MKRGRSVSGNAPNAWVCLVTLVSTGLFNLARILPIEWNHTELLATGPLPSLVKALNSSPWARLLGGLALEPVR